MLPRTSRRVFPRTALLAAASLLGAASYGATLTWNGGLPGDWNTANTNWSGSTWSNSNPDDAVFNNISGTITLTEAITAGSVSFNAGGRPSGSHELILTGGNLTASSVAVWGGYNPALGGGGVDSVTDAYNQRLAVQNMTLTVSGDASVRRGMLFVNAATLNVGGAIRSTDAWNVFRSDNSTVTATGGIDFSAIASVVELKGGTITTPFIKVGNHTPADTGLFMSDGVRIVATQDNADFIQVYASGNINSRAAATLNAGGVNLDTSTFAVTISTVLNGAGGLTKSGNGTLTLSGASTYAGGTTVSAGTLIITSQANAGGSSSLGNSAPSNLVTIGNGGTLTGSNYNWLDSTALAAGGTNAHSVQVDTGGTLKGASDYITGLGNITLSGGTLEVSNGFVYGSWNGSFTLGGDITVTGTTPSAITTSAGAGASANLQMSNGANGVGGTRTFRVNDVTASAASDLVVSARLANGTIVKEGAGTLEMTTGATGTATSVNWTVNAGTLLFRTASDAASHAVASGATLEFDVASGSRDLTTSGFSGAGTIRKTGAGGLVWGAGVATFALDSGALIDVRAGTFTGGSNGNDIWTNNKSDLNVESGATFNTVEANVRLNKITGAGTIRTGYGGAGYQNLTIGVDNGSSTFDGVITNADAAGTLVKAGTGTITLTGGNTYTGGTTVNGGTLVVSGTYGSGSTSLNGGRLVNGAASGTSFSLGALSLNGGELAATSTPAGNLGNYQLRGDITVGGSSMSTISADVRVVNNETRTFTVADVDGGAGVDLLLSGKIGHHNGTAWGYATKAGAGTMKLSGVNEIGGLTVSAGLLILENTAIPGFGATGLTNNAAAEFGVTTGSATAGYTISGSGTLTKSGNGTLALSAHNTFAGGTTVSAGTLNIDIQGNQAASALGANRAVTVASGATLRLAQTDGLGYWAANPSSLVIGGTMTIAAGKHASIGNFGLTLDGGTLTAEGAGSSEGNYILDGTVTTLANASASVIDAQLVKLRNGSGAANQAVTFDVADGAASTDLTVSSVLANGNGANGLIKSGNGTLTLSGNNTYAGGTTINGGTLRATRNTLGTGAVVVNSGGTLQANDQWVFCGANGYNVNERNVGSLTLNAGGTLHLDPTQGFANGINNFTLNGGAVTGGANGDVRGALFLYAGNQQITAGGNATSTIGVSLGLNGNNSITVDGGSRLEMTNVLKRGDFGAAGRGGIVKNGAGTLVLSGANSYDGQTDIAAGTLVAASSTALGAGGHAGETMSWIRDGATLALQGGITLDEHFHVWGAGVGGFGAVRSLSGNNSLTNAGNGGTGFALRSNTTVGVDAGTLTVTGFYEDQGSFSLTKVGNGTLMLSNINTYTGGTVVNSGTLSLNANGGNGNVRGVLTVNAGGTVETTGDGTGLGYSIRPSKIIINGGTISSAGTMHIWDLGGGLEMTGGTLRSNLGASTTDGPQLEWRNTNVSTFASDSTATIAGRIRLRADSGNGLALNIADGTAATDLLISAAITESGAQGLTKSGNGTLVLSGVNSYTGATTINGGTLVLDAGGTYAYAGGNIAINGGSTLRVSGLAYTFNGKTIAFGAAGGGTLDAIATGAGGMYLTGANTITTSGGAQNTLSGTRIGTQNQGINLNSQTLTFDVAAGSDPAVPNLNVTGTLWNSGNLTKSGNGILLLSGNSEYSGTTTINAGTIIFRGASASSSHGIATGAALEFDVASGSRDLNTASFTGAGALRKTGAGEIVWGGGTATFALDSGALIDVRAGTFKGGSHANENWTNNKSDLNVESGAVFNTVEANVRVNSITGAGTIKTGYGGAGYANLTIGVDNGSSTFAGVIENADATGNLVKAGSGAITLSGANTYSGSTTVNDGTLKVTTLGTAGGSSVGSSDRSNAANLLLNGPVTFEYAGAGESTSRSFTVSGTGLTLSSTGAGAVNFTIGSSIAFADSHANRELKLSGTNTGANTFGSSLSGSPADADKINKITKDGVGTWILSGPANRFRNTLSIDVNAGTLGLAQGAVDLSDASALIALNAGATLRWEAGNTADLANRLYLLPAGQNTEATVEIVAGTVSFADPLASGSNLTFVKAGAGTLEFNTDQPEIAGVRVNSGKLTAKANGALGLGAATVAGGALSIAQGVSVTNAINVSSGGTLSGKGSTGAVTVASGGVLSPGSSPGVLTHSSLTLSGGSIINWEVYDATGAAGGGYDRLVISGNLDLRGASSINKITIKISSLSAPDASGNPLNFGPPDGVSSIRTFQFGQVGGLLQTNGENISDLFSFDVTDFRYSDGSFSNASLWSINWNAGAITLTAVPEPSTYGLGLGALALAAAALRRRRRPAPQA